LNDEQQRAFVEGRKVLIEDVISRTGALFDVYQQINASRKERNQKFTSLNGSRQI
jgi:hypothetical protein